MSITDQRSSFQARSFFHVLYFQSEVWRRVPTNHQKWAFGNIGKQMLCSHCPETTDKPEILINWKRSVPNDPKFLLNVMKLPVCSTQNDMLVKTSLSITLVKVCLCIIVTLINVRSHVMSNRWLIATESRMQDETGPCESLRWFPLVIH